MHQLGRVADMEVSGFHGGVRGPCLQLTPIGAGQFEYHQLTASEALQLAGLIATWLVDTAARAAARLEALEAARKAARVT